MSVESGIHCRNAIGQQRQRVLQMHSLITRQQLERSNIPESEDEEDNTKESVITTTATTSNEPISVMRNRLFGDRQDTTGDQSTEIVLSHHRMLQDDIAESMVGMARNLKDRSIAFGEALREDSKVAPPPNSPNSQPFALQGLMAVGCERFRIAGKECREDDADGRKITGLYPDFKGNDVVYIGEYCGRFVCLVGYVFSYKDYLFCEIVR